MAQQPLLTRWRKTWRSPPPTQQIQDAITKVLEQLGENLYTRRQKVRRDVMQNIIVRDRHGRVCFYAGNGIEVDVAGLIHRELKLSVWRPRHRALVAQLAADLEATVVREGKIYYRSTFLRRNHHGPGICLYISGLRRK